MFATKSTDISVSNNSSFVHNKANSDGGVVFLNESSTATVSPSMPAHLAATQPMKMEEF